MIAQFLVGLVCGAGAFAAIALRVADQKDKPTAKDEAVKWSAISGGGSNLNAVDEARLQ
jgi:hypothetical protein